MLLSRNCIVVGSKEIPSFGGSEYILNYFVRQKKDAISSLTEEEKRGHSRGNNIQKKMKRIRKIKMRHMEETRAREISKRVCSR